MDEIARIAGDLAHLPDRATYLQVTSQLLFALIPAELVGWNKVTREGAGSEVAGFPVGAVESAVAAEALAAASADHPLIHSYLDEPPGVAVPAPRRMSDVVSQRDLHRTTAYDVLLRPLGAERMLSVLTARLTPDSAAGWALTRGERDFTDDEVELVARLQPTLRLLDLAHAPSAGLPAWTDAPGAVWAERHGLSAREAEVLDLVARGLTAGAIGHLLGISPRTVSKHLQHAYARLGCDNRVSALVVLHGGRPPRQREP